METKSRERLVLKAIAPGKSYGTTALRAARHFWAVDEGARATDLADELQLEPEAAVVCVLDAKTKPLGIIERDRLFALLGKPFGREILGRMPARELAEPAPLIDVHAGIFAVAQEALASEDDEGALYRVLVGSDGGFQGILSTRDLAAFMSRMTRDDIELAARLQERLQEGNEPIGGAGWAFEAWSRPAKGVGGISGLPACSATGECSSRSAMSPARESPLPSWWPWYGACSACTISATACRASSASSTRR